MSYFRAPTTLLEMRENIYCAKKYTFIVGLLHRKGSGHLSSRFKILEHWHVFDMFTELSSGLNGYTCNHNYGQ